MFLSKYGVARHIYIPIIKRAVVDFAVGADWTPAAGDVKISKDGGAAANVTNLPAAIAMGNGAVWDFSLTATEMQAAQVIVTVADSATKAVEDQSFIIETHGNAAAQFQLDLADIVRAGLTALPNAAAEAAGGLYTRGTGAGQINQPANGMVDANVVRNAGTAITAAAGIQEVKVASIATDAITAASIQANAIGAAEIADGAIDAATFAAGAINAAAIAADAITAAKIADGAIDAATFAAGAINAAAIAADAITAAKIADGAIDAATLATGTITAAKFAAGAIDAAAIAADAITAAKVAADVTTEIQSGLATAASLSTVAGYIDTEIADIQARLPAALVSGRIDASVGAMAASVVTASAIAADAIGASELAADAATEIGTAVWASATRLLTAGTNIVLAKGVGVTGFNDLSAAAVNAEVLDVMVTDTHAEPGQGAPAATASLKDKIGYLYKAWRNKITQSATEYKLFADDATTVDQKKTVADAAGTVTVGEVATGP